MLHLLDGSLARSSDRGRLRAAVVAHVDAVRASKGRGDLTMVGRAEAAVRADPGRRIRFDAHGRAAVDIEGRTLVGGRFSTPSIGELRRLASRQGADAKLRLFVLDGASPGTDIGALQATSPPESLFQVASQFNCLESPGAHVTDVTSYLHDSTQGPRASISALPGTLVRHYAAPGHDGARFTQASAGRQLELLEDVTATGIAAVRSGYLLTSDIVDPAAFARRLEERFDRIRIGLHEDVEVVLGYDWDGAVEGPRTITQVFTSTVAAGAYGIVEGDAGIRVCRQLLRAAYLGTLLAAAALDRRYVALTLIGGGVFGNPIPVIWESLLWAVAEAEACLRRDLLVAVNGRNLGESIPAVELAAAARARGGALIRFDRGGGVTIDA